MDYIADFYCAEKNLIIEIDGGYHDEEEQKRLDNYRSERLENVGYRIIRFTNTEVIENTEETINRIKKILNE